MTSLNLPKWKDIPSIPGMPHGTAWGLFDKNGVKDEIGTINLLTPEVVIKAGKEIQTGKSVALNWGLEKLHNAGFGRKALVHRFVNWRTTDENGEEKGFYCFDDEVEFNTQTGSQWDGLRHWGHSKTGLYYNGIRHNDLLKSSHLGTDYWTKRGGIVGRGVLLDYVSYAERHSIAYSPMSAHVVSIRTLQAIAVEQNLEFHEGDILIVRTGWTKWYEAASDEDRLRYVTNGKEWVGVEGCKETVEWLWDQRFAAVAGDNIGFEVWPATDDWRLHDHLLSMFGMPIGEMWDLEVLKEECERQKRWSFFFTSAPLNVTGGVASPPNALAIF